MKHVPVLIIGAVAWIVAVRLPAQATAPGSSTPASASVADVTAFRSGVTATVERMSDRGGCAVITLRWVPFPKASSYAVLLSDQPDRGWRPVTSDSACVRGARRADAPQSRTLHLVVAAGARRYIRISALDGAGQPMDFTSPLLVELK